jgi:hypothetical protein
MDGSRRVGLFFNKPPSTLGCLSIHLPSSSTKIKIAFDFDYFKSQSPEPPLFPFHQWNHCLHLVERRLAKRVGTSTKGFKHARK